MQPTLASHERAHKTLVDVGGDLFHRPGKRDPEHVGSLRCRLDDALRIAEPCPECFPEFSTERQES